MKLSGFASQYVAYKQDMGMRFHTEARTLKSFCRTMGDVAIAEITPDRVRAFIAGTGPVTRFWHRKYEVPRWNPVGAVYGGECLSPTANSRRCVAA